MVTQSPSDSTNASINNSLNAPPQPDDAVVPETPSTQQQPAADHSSPINTPFSQQASSSTSSPSILSTPRQEGATPRQEGVRPFSIPPEATRTQPISVESAPTAHPLANDPRSRHFARQHPQRERNPAQSYTPSIRGKSYHGQATYVDPQQASALQVFQNYCMTALSRNSVDTPAVLYQLETTADVSDFAASGSTVAFRADVQSTTDLGDVPIPRSYRQAMASPHASYWQEAMHKEIAGLVKQQTWKEVPYNSLPKHANIMHSHWIFTVKRRQTGEIEKWKARCVADGNSQLKGVDYQDVFSTVVKMSTVRIVLSIAAARDYNLASVDVCQAFLQAEVTDDLYMRVPPGMPAYDKNGNHLCLKLIRSIYGLKQAGRCWNKLLVSFLVTWGFAQSKIDVCLFTYAAGSSILWLLVWVDDIVQVDNDAALRERFTSALAERFPIEDRGALEWVLGIHIKRDRAARVIKLSQELYIADLLNRHSDVIGSGHSRRYTSPMDDKMRLSTELSPKDGSPEQAKMEPLRHTYMSIVGGLLWLSNVTRFELAFAASQLARFVSNPGEIHFNAAVRVLIYLQGTADRALVFSPSKTGSRPFEIYVDSDWATKFSSSGALYFYNGCLVAWFAKVQRSVSFSSAESEMFGAILAAKDGVFYRELFVDLGVSINAPTRIFTDSKSVVDLSLDPVSFKKTKHILRAAEGLRHYVARLVFTLVHLPGRINMADILTKAQAPSVFVELMIAYDAHVAA